MLSARMNTTLGFMLSLTSPRQHFDFTDTGRLAVANSAATTAGRVLGLRDGGECLGDAVMLPPCCLTIGQ